GRKSKGITPDSFGAQPPPSPHNPPSPLPPSRGEAASSNGRKTPQKGGKMATFAGTCYVAGYGATPLLSCDCVNCHQISAERHIATTIYSLRTCVENMVPQTFKKTQIDKAFRIATPMRKASWTKRFAAGWGERLRARGDSGSGEGG